ncbi:MAG: hypothetical protein R3F60_00845 [bacterium]
MPGPNSNLRQVDPGTYNVKQGGGNIGTLYAEGTAGVMVVEHWVLHAGYQSPTATLNMEVFKVASGGYTSLTAFLTAMQGQVNSANASATYIKATCVYDTIDPE